MKIRDCKLIETETVDDIIISEDTGKININDESGKIRIVSESGLEVINLKNTF